jgi:hypothetical protein
MKTADYFVKYFLLFTSVLIFVRTCKTILFIYHLPDSRAIVMSVRLNVFIKIKVLSLIVLFVLYMPHPIHALILSLFFPHIEICTRLMLNLISLDPILRNILLVTSAYITSIIFANPILYIQRALTI